MKYNLYKGAGAKKAVAMALAAAMTVGGALRRMRRINLRLKIFRTTGQSRQLKVQLKTTL